MDNAISRSAIAEVLRGKSIDTEPDVEYVADELYKRFKHFDAVPVVRCKDCKFAFQNNGHDKEGCPIMDRRVWMNGNSFCSEGELIDKQEATK